MKQPLESVLHAYVDGRLDDGQRAELEAWLADHGEAAARVDDWRRQKEGLHQCFDPVLEEPVPARLLGADQRSRAVAYWRSMGGVAAAAAWLAVGVVAGYFVRGGDAGGGRLPQALAQQAAVAHAVYVPEVRHPVEVTAEREDHLLQWLTRRLGVSVHAPSLQAAGFSLMGGRLLPGEAGPAAQFMYQDSGGRRVTLYLRTKVKGGRETAFRFARENGLAAFYWIDGEVGYALVGDLPREELLVLADAAYRGLEIKDGPAPGQDKPG